MSNLGQQIQQEIDAIKALRTKAETPAGQDGDSWATQYEAFVDAVQTQLDAAATQTALDEKPDADTDTQLSNNEVQAALVAQAILNEQSAVTADVDNTNTTSEVTTTGELSVTTVGSQTDDEYLRLAPDYADSGSGTSADPYINAIKNAKASLPAEGGQIIIPSGVWCSEDGLLIDTKPVQIRGAGRGQSFILGASSLTGPVVEVATTQSGSEHREFATLRDLTINGRNNGTDGLVVSGDRHSFENVQIDLLGRDGIRYSGVDNEFRNVYVSRAGVGFNAVAGTTPKFYGGRIRQSDVGIRMDGGAHSLFSGTIIEQCDSEAIQHYVANNAAYRDIHMEYNGAVSGVSTTIGDSGAASAEEHNLRFENCSWGGNDATTIIDIINAENVVIDQPLFGSAATDSINVDPSCRKIRVRQAKDLNGVSDPSSTITHENKVTIPAGADPTTTDYDVTRTFDGAIIDNGTQRWVVVDETDENGATSHLTPPPTSFIRVDKTTTQTIPSGTPTKVEFGDVRTDINGNYDATTYEFTVSETGLYNVSARVSWDPALPSGTRTIIYLHRNNSVIDNSSIINHGGVTSNSISEVYQNAGGTRYSVYVYQDSGGGVDLASNSVANTFSVTQLR